MHRRKQTRIDAEYVYERKIDRYVAAVLATISFDADIGARGRKFGTFDLAANPARHVHPAQFGDSRAINDSNSGRLKAGRT